MKTTTTRWAVQFDHSRDLGDAWLDWGRDHPELRFAEAEMARLRDEYPHYGVRIVRRTLVEEIVEESER